MRNLIKPLALLGGAALGVLLIAAPAFAGTIFSPSSPFSVTGPGTDGQQNAFDVTVHGFIPGQQVFLEQCDGTASTTPGWSPGNNCDNGTAPAPGIADSNGNYTFLATDSNHHFIPWKGTLPSGGFDCLSPNETPPNDGLPQFGHNGVKPCQLRASSNNSASTSDQSFINLVMPEQGASTPEVPIAIVLPIGAILIGGAFLLINRRRAARAPAQA